MKKYAINKEFGLYAHFRPWIVRPLLPVMNLVLSLGMGLVRPPRGVSSKDVRITGFNGRTFGAKLISPQGDGGSLPVLIYFHGGGFILKGAWTHLQLAAEYAQSVPCRVLFPDYSLAPAHPYPAAVDDCLAAYKWALENLFEIGEDMRIAVGGDSAGGCLAAITAIMARDRALPLPLMQMLIYPATDHRMQTDSMRRFTDTPMWNAVLSERMWKWYLKDRTDTKYASPMYCGSLSGLPPAYVETAEFDCLRDEGKAFADALTAAGCDVEYSMLRGTMHGYDAASGTPTVRRALERRISALKAVLYG